MSLPGVQIRGVWTRQDTDPIYSGANPTTSRGPPDEDWPDATTTGVPAGTTLTPSGSINTSSNGQVIDSMEVTGAIIVNHANVTISKCKVNAASVFRGILHNSGDGLAVTDTEVFDAVADGVNSTSGASATFTRLHIHDCDDNIKRGANTDLFDSYIHGYIITGGSHNDGLQISDGSNMITDGNRIDGPYQGQTSAMIVKADFGLIDNVTITNNRLSGGAYTLYVRKGTSFATPTNVTITGNTFEKESFVFGAFSFDTPTATWVWNTNVWNDGDPYPSPF